MSVCERCACLCTCEVYMVCLSVWRGVCLCARDVCVCV